MSDLRPPTHDELASLVDRLDPRRADGTRADWIALGMAIHDADPSEAGYILFEDFSRQSSKFNLKDCQRAWKSFKPGTITVATLIKYANEDDPAGSKRRSEGQMLTTKRDYAGLDDYAAEHGVPASVLRNAGWRETTHDDRPALVFRTANGSRWRFLDGEKPDYDSPVGYQRCWYGLEKAIAIALRYPQPLVLCNGEISTVAAQYHGVAAFAVAGGSEKPTLPDALVDALRARWSGPILLALDCDATGRAAAPQLAAQLRSAGMDARAIDLKGGNGYDLADFCNLHNGSSATAIAGLPELEIRSAAPERAPAPFRIYRGDAIDQVTAPRQLVKGFLSIGTVALMIGPSESGKSTIAVDLANKVAQHYGVIYIAAEDAGNVRSQIRAWELLHSKPRSPNLALIDGPVLVGDTAQVSTLISVAREMAPRLIVVDTLGACIPGADENSSEMGAVTANLNRIADELGAAVLVLHHPLKYDGAMFRGHSSLLNNTHTMLLVQRDDGDEQLTLSVTRHKGTRAAPATLRLVVKETDIVDPDDGPIAAPIALPSHRVMLSPDHLSTRQRAILQYLFDLDADGGATAAEIAREIAGQFKTSEGRVRCDIASLVKRGFMTRGERQRDPRTITPKGSGAIRCDQVDQVDQVPPADPFEINTRLAESLTRRSGPIAPTESDLRQENASNEKPDRTRSDPIGPDRDQVLDPGEKPDHLIDSFRIDQVIGFQASAGDAGDQAVPDEQPPGHPCNHQSCFRAGAKYCLRPSAGPDSEGCESLPDLPAVPDALETIRAMRRPPEEVTHRLARERQERESVDAASAEGG